MATLEKLSDDLNNYVKKEMEGNVYCHYFIDTFEGKSFWINAKYYTVKDGDVYIIEGDGDKLTKSGDDLFTVRAQCRKVGKYKPEKKYKSVINELEHADLLKILKTKYIK